MAPFQFQHYSVHLESRALLLLWLRSESFWLEGRLSRAPMPPRCFPATDQLRQPRLQAGPTTVRNAEGRGERRTAMRYTRQRYSVQEEKLTLLTWTSLAFSPSFQVRSGPMVRGLQRRPPPRSPTSLSSPPPQPTSRARRPANGVVEPLCDDTSGKRKPTCLSRFVEAGARSRQNRTVGCGGRDDKHEKKTAPHRSAENSVLRLNRHVARCGKLRRRRRLRPTTRRHTDTEPTAHGIPRERQHHSQYLTSKLVICVRFL